MSFLKSLNGPWPFKVADHVQYFEGFADKYELHPYIKLNSRVVSATWDEAKGIYNVKVNSEGKEIDDWCHVLGMPPSNGILTPCADS